EVRDKMGSDDVLEVMHRLLMKHGKPEFIRSDNGGEFVAQHLQNWLRKVGVRPSQIYPSSGDDGGGMGAKVALILPQGSFTGQADLLLV
ncbi:MAG: hypothetical protein L7S68_01995, partial [Planktomarina temperata]|nr:hypothetical protein [Planktomarina temperata]